MKIVIVIPIYKKIPTKVELASFQQCFNVLGNYSISIVTYRGLDLSVYQNAVHKFLDAVYFNRRYFESISGYNCLMKQNGFYRKFRRFDYMLIYQLDAWVFNDSLMEWCNKGYDYIGAPWFENFSTHEEGKKLWKVGNGGLSLRLIDKFCKITRSSLRCDTIRDIFLNDYCGLRSLPFCIAKVFGYKNTMRYYSQKTSSVNEDYYFAVMSEKYSKIKLQVPDAIEAASFSIECSPQYLIKMIGRLPFGCHAFEKYEWDFWKHYITFQ